MVMGSFSENASSGEMSRNLSKVQRENGSWVVGMNNGVALGRMGCAMETVALVGGVYVLSVGPEKPWGLVTRNLKFPESNGSHSEGCEQIRGWSEQALGTL